MDTGTFICVLSVIQEGESYMDGIISTKPTGFSSGNREDFSEPLADPAKYLPTSDSGARVAEGDLPCCHLAAMYPPWGRLHCRTGGTGGHNSLEVNIMSAAYTF